MAHTRSSQGRCVETWIHYALDDCTTEVWLAPASGRPSSAFWLFRLCLAVQQTAVLFSTRRHNMAALPSATTGPRDIRGSLSDILKRAIGERTRVTAASGTAIVEEARGRALVHLPIGAFQNSLREDRNHRRTESQQQKGYGNCLSSSAKPRESASLTAAIKSRTFWRLPEPALNCVVSPERPACRNRRKKLDGLHLDLHFRGRAQAIGLLYARLLSKIVDCLAIQRFQEDCAGSFWISAVKLRYVVLSVFSHRKHERAASYARANHSSASYLLSPYRKCYFFQLPIAFY